VFVFLVLSTAAWAWQEPQAKPQPDLSDQVRQRMAANLAGLPNYTCLETIDRTLRRQPAKKVLFRDRIRMEVAFIAASEMFSWPGAADFEADLLDQLPPTGASGAGGFGGWTRSLFGPSAPGLAVGGECMVEGRRGLKYNFSVPVEASKYAVTFGGRAALLPYNGYLCVDADASQIMELAVHAEQVPQPVATMSETIHYGRTRIGAADFLLPMDHELTVTDLEGKENRSFTHFTACREYTAESSIVFDTEHRAAAPPPTKVEELHLPDGIQLELLLETPINSEESAVGDPIAARLDRAVNFSGVAIPKGATVSGRIVGLEQYLEPEGYFIVSLEFTSLTFGDKRAQFHARLVGPRPHEDRRLEINGVNMEHSMPNGLDILDSAPGAGVFRVQAGKLRLSRGLHMTWKTESGKQ
jgi:hypothetical protein